MTAKTLDEIKDELGEVFSTAVNKSKYYFGYGADYQERAARDLEAAVEAGKLILAIEQEQRLAADSGYKPLEGRARPK